MAALLVSPDAWAGQMIREAAGANNGNTAGSQPSGRREINWDGGGAPASVTLDPTPMTRFSNRGATFVTPGSGFEISGQPAPLLEELNPAYAGLFAAFSAPRIFTPLDSNVMDTLFHLRPGTITGGGQTFRCTLGAGLVPVGDHTLQVELQFGAERRRNAVRWSVVANTEP